MALQSRDLTLIGHLQVMEEPIISVYRSDTSGKHYVFIKVFDDDRDFFVISEVLPNEVLSFMAGSARLSEILHEETYECDDRITSFSRISYSAMTLRMEESGIGQMFERELSYKALALRGYFEKW